MGFVQVQRLSKRYGRAIGVEDVSFDVGCGDLCALLGPSGSGKSTVLRLIAGLEVPTSGRVLIDDADVTERPPQARGVGFVFQNYALFRHLDVFDNVAFGLRIRDEDAELTTARVHELLELFGLGGFAHRMPHELSGGQRQRVALARALAARPRLLLLDEPFAALDARVRQDLRDWLRDMHDRMGVTSIFVTHDQEEAAALADRVIVMSGGRVEQIDSPRGVYDRPASDFVADFIGPTNSVLAEVRGGSAVADGFRMECQPGIAEGTRVVVRIRPHDVQLGRWPVGLRAVVRRTTFMGAQVRVDVQLLRNGPVLVAFLNPREADRMKLEPGRHVRVRILAGRVSPDSGRGPSLTPPPINQPRRTTPAPGELHSMDEPPPPEPEP